MKKNKIPKKGFRVILGIILTLLATTFLPALDKNGQPDNYPENPSQNSEQPFVPMDLSVHFIDVGQGDSILIESSGHYMLIDAGENSKGILVKNYLYDLGVKKLDYLIGTHPHSDHIGGLDDIIKAFEIDKIIMPDVVHTTKTFEDVIDAISDKNLKITKAITGNTYNLGDASFTIIAPNSSTYDNLNDYSVGIKLINGNNSFIFTGDAEKASEKEMLNSGIALSADLLKLGHHGSSTSNHKDFLDRIAPTYAVITVGADNSYGHPHDEILQEMMDRNIQVFRTDIQETIIAHSDGKSITINKEPYTITESDFTHSTFE